MISIRLYKESDWQNLVEVFSRNVPKYFAAHELNDLKYYLGQHSKTYYIVEVDGVLVGAGGYHLFGNKGRLSWDFFDPAFHGKGLGRRLITHCLMALQQEKKLTAIEVWTSQLAYGFYERFGFVTHEIKHDYWAKGLDLYRMIKPNRDISVV